MSPERLLVLIVVLPLIGACGAFVAPRIARWLGLLVSASLVCLTALLAIDVAAQRVVELEVGGWSAPLGIALRVDGLSALLLLAVAGVGLAISVYSHAYFGGGSVASKGWKPCAYWSLWMFLLAALNAMLVSGDAFNIYVTLELSGFAAVALVALTNKEVAVRSAQRYLFVSLTGSLMYLMGVALLYGGYGTLNLASLADRIVAGPFALVALVLMTCGLMMKAALFPMHFWLPPAHGSAHAPVSAALSALVIKGSVYLLIRVWFEVFGGVVDSDSMQVMGAFGAAAIFWGSFQALIQARMKLVIAYSTVAQVGYLFLAFPLAAGAADPSLVWTGVLTLMLSHAAAKSAMFLAAGNVQQAAGHDRIEALCGVTRILPVSAFAMGMAAVSLVGLPPTAGFIGKWLLIGAGLEQGQWWLVGVMLAGSLLAAASMMRILGPAFISENCAVVHAPLVKRLEWPCLVLALISVLLGFVTTGPARLLQGVLSTGLS